jgi:hypothetical protein
MSPRFKEYIVIASWAIYGNDYSKISIFFIFNKTIYSYNEVAVIRIKRNLNLCFYSV